MRFIDVFRFDFRNAASVRGEILSVNQRSSAVEISSPQPPDARAECLEAFPQLPLGLCNGPRLEHGFAPVKAPQALERHIHRVVFGVHT